MPVPQQISSNVKEDGRDAEYDKDAPKDDDDDDEDRADRDDEDDDDDDRGEETDDDEHADDSREEGTLSVSIQSVKMSNIFSQAVVFT